jgi:hypothetical protein
MTKYSARKSLCTDVQESLGRYNLREKPQQAPRIILMYMIMRDFQHGSTLSL